MTWNHALAHKLEAFVSFLSRLQHTQAIMRVPPPSLPPPDAVEIQTEKRKLINSRCRQLKENLSFEGSKVILMSRDEIKFMVASARFKEGK